MIFFGALIAQVYDLLRADNKVGFAWCGSYQSLAVWEHETERGHVVLNLSPNLVKAYTVMEGQRRMEVELKLMKALNGEDELRCWTSFMDDKPPLILRQLVPGVWQVLLHRPESLDAELEWVPVERHYVR